MISFRGLFLLTAGIAVSLASLPLSNPFLAILGASVISFTAASAYNFSRLAGKARLSVERETSPKKLPEGETASCTLEIKTGTSLPCTAEDNVPPFFKTSGGTRASFQGSGTLNYSFSSPTRGLFSIGPAKVTASDPAGLFRAELFSGVTQQVLFYPSLAEVKRYDVKMRRRSFHHSSGIRKAIARGAGTEFVALRKYAAGDEFRQIDWKATARSRQLIVRTFEAERRQRVVIALDAGRLMHSGKTVSMLDAGINAAVLLSHVVLKRGDLLGFAAFSSRLDCFVKPGNSRAQFYAILDALGRITPSEETDFVESFRKLTAALTKRSLIIVISSLQGEDAKRIAEAVKLLKAHRHAIVIIAPFEPWFEPLPEKDPLSLFIAESAEEKYRKDLDLVTSAVRRFGACVIPVGPESAGPSTLRRYAYAVNRGLASV